MAGQQPRTDEQQRQQRVDAGGGRGPSRSARAYDLDAVEEHVYQQLYDLEDGHWWFRGRRAVLWAMLRRAGAAGPPAACSTPAAGRAATWPSSAGSGPPAASTRRRRRSSSAAAAGSASVEAAGIEALPFADGDVRPDPGHRRARARRARRRRRDRAAPRRGARRAAGGHRARRTAGCGRSTTTRTTTCAATRRRSLRGRLAAAGWRPVLLTYFNSLLLPPIALVRAARAAPRAARRADRLPAHRRAR